MPQKSKQLEAMLQGVIAATPEKSASSVAQQPAMVTKDAPAPAQALRQKPDDASISNEAGGQPALASEWLEEERESFDCPVIVKRHLARIAVDRPDMSMRALYLQAVAQVYGIEIPYQVLRDRRRRQR